MKKIISAGLATILAASALSTAAFADEFTMTAESILAKPAIKVTLPKSMAFVFNPYQLKVNLKGAVDNTEAGKGGTGFTVVPSYLFETDATGWDIINGSGAPLKAAIVAYAINKTDAEFQVIDATADLPGAAKRALKVKITANEDNVVTLQNVTEKVDTKTKSIWDETDDGAGAKVLKGDNAIAADGKLTIALDTEETVTAHAANDTSSWSDKDAVKINFIFGFDLEEPEA